MNQLIHDYNQLKYEINQRLNDFKNIKDDDLFYELCFCILTPQSSGFRADECIQELKKLDFKNKNINPKPILKKKIRFHNNKSNYLLLAKKSFLGISSKLNEIKNLNELREYLVENVKGLGLKESSHFLRNIGYENLAILDRHILKNLKEYKVINKIPKTLTKKEYYRIEKRFKSFSNRIGISLDALDLLFWSKETGKIFK